MSITLSVPPAIVQEVRLYAERHNTSLNALLRAYMDKLAEEERALREKASLDVYSFLMNQKGWLPSDYHFDREEANAR